VLEVDAPAPYRGQLFGERALCEAVRVRRRCEVERDRWQAAASEVRAGRAALAREAEAHLRACRASLGWARMSLEAVPDPPSRLWWAGIGAGAVVAPVAVGVLLDWPEWGTAAAGAGGLAVALLVAWGLD